MKKEISSWTLYKLICVAALLGETNLAR